MRASLAIGLIGAAMLPSIALAEGLVPRGFTFTYRSLADSSVVTELAFDAEPSDVAVGVADTSFTLKQVIRAVWSGGPDDGLAWFFTDSDSVAATDEVLFHGFARPGLASVLFEPGQARPTETFPQVWAPAAFQDGATWSWTGRGLCADYTQDRTESYQAAREVVDVPYRGTWTGLRIDVAEPVKCGLRLPDGRSVDAFGRVVPEGRTSKIGEPRWLAAVSTGADRWTILLKDSLVELQAVEIDGSSIVPVGSTSMSDLKRRFRP